MTSGALDGVLVADFSRVLAGPYATMLLADLGADVVKVERPATGDDTRAWGPPWDDAGRSTYFLGVNRNKRSLALDLKDPEDLGTARALARKADVVVENFIPGTLDGLGLGYEAVRKDNPGVVYASISGFGAGAGAALPGYDLLVQAMGGLMSVTGPEADHPTKVGVALVDVVTGLHAAVGVLAALRHRERTGEGQRVEVNLLSSLLSALVNQASGYVVAGVVPGILGNRHPSIAPYETVPASDRSFVVAVGNDRQFGALVEALGLSEMAADPRFVTNPERVDHRDALVDLLAAVTCTRPAAEWVAILSTVGVPCGPINDVAEAVALAEQLGLEPVVESGGTRTIAHPVRLSATPASYRLPPPDLGADDTEVRDGLS
ncbi:MAG TPA: CoA transferase [Candidatus Limnocylindria bacterium]|nr:CoA transferase [Candidatus Limnocylindria bacterium]